MTGNKRIPAYLGVIVLLLLTSAEGIEISDSPLMAKVDPPPANIMFIVDNSQSMSWEIMLKDSSHPMGLFNPNINVNNVGKLLGQSIAGEIPSYAYVFGDDALEVAPGTDSFADLVNQGKQDHIRMRFFTSKKFWKTRCHAFNTLYYNPSARYLPWPKTAQYSHLGNADVTLPRLNPLEASPTVNLKSEYMKIQYPNLGGNDEPDLSEISDADFRDIELDDDMAIRIGNWNRQKDDSATIVFNDAYHITKDRDAAIIYPFELRSKGEVDVEFYWPYFLALSPAGHPNVSGEKREVNLRLYDHRFNPDDSEENNKAALLKEEKVNQKGKSINIIKDVKISSLSKEGPDLYAVMVKDGANKNFMVADKVEVSGKIRINNAHYVTFSDENGNGEIDGGEDVFLVNFEWDEEGACYRQFYGISQEDEDLGIGELRPYATRELPARLRALYDSGYTAHATGENVSVNPTVLSASEDLQNFSNWLQYYRTKLHATKSAMGNAIYNMSGVNMGFLPVKSVDQNQDGQDVLPVHQGGGSGSSVVIVDDKDAAYFSCSPGGELSGNGWEDSNADVAYAGNSKFTTVKNATASWTAALSEAGAGTYDVYIRWSAWKGVGKLIGLEHPLLCSRDPEAKYSVVKINNAGGETIVKTEVVNQEFPTQPGWMPERWNKICTVSLQDGDQKKIVVKLDRTLDRFLFFERLHPTSADAIKVVRQGAADADNAETLLNALYRIDTQFDTTGEITPLRTALDAVGRYYHTENAPPSGSGLGDSPYVSSEEGGGCQQSFVVAMTDGYWSGPTPSDIEYQDNDGVSDTFADVANHYYREDLAPNLADLVPVNVFDQNSKQHMVTYAVTFGKGGNLDPDTHKYWLEGADPDSWDWPGAGDWAAEDYVDDLFHGTVNGHGRYFNASSPDQMIAGFRKVLEDIVERTETSGASVALNGGRVRDGLVLYQTEYYPMSWLGDLKAKSLDLTNQSENIEVGTLLWSAAEKLSAVSWDERKVISSYGTTVFSFEENQIPETLKSWMMEDTDRFEIPVTAESMVAYVRGKEMEGLRSRYARREDAPAFRYKMGDLVHSAPVYQRGSVYAGGNGGGLHVFDAQNGEERFFFIPSFVYGNLSRLGRTDYMNEHRFFVDGSPQIRNLLRGGEEYDLLAGGLRKGGKGYYGMTLFDSGASFDVSSLQRETILESELGAGLSPWEFPPVENRTGDALDGDMGYSFSKPVIVASNIPAHPWVVMFGNGYNSEDGKAVLLILDAFTGAELSRIDTETGGENGLSTPAVVDTDNNGTADWVYAGDLKGNLWKFDVSGSSVEEWDVFYENSGSPQPLFTAEGVGSAAVQPITARPGVAKHCSGHGYMVLFGTGKYLATEDISSSAVQTFYGIWDYGDGPDEYIGTLDRTSAADHGYRLKGEALPAGGDVSLIEQKVMASSSPSNGASVSQGSHGSSVNVVVESHTNYPQTWEFSEDPDGGMENVTSGNVGWFFDLPDIGERMIQDILIVGEYAVGISFVPEGGVSVCSSGGYSWFNEVEACTGSRASIVLFDVDDNRKLETAKQNDAGEWVYGDSLIVEDTVCEVSRTRVEGMMFNPKILKGDENDIKISSTSQLDSIRVITERREGDGLFYWRQR